MRVVLDLLDELTNTRFSACFTTECGNPDILKSMSTTWNIEDEPIGCPITTGLPFLSWSASSSKLVFLQSREKRVSISWALERDVFSVTTGLPVLSWFGFGFGWVGWEPSACRATSEPNSFIQSCFKEIFGGSRGDVYTFRIQRLQFPSEQLSGYNKLGVYREEWWRSIASDRTSVLSFGASLMSTQLHCVLMFLPCFVHVLCKTRCSQVDRVRILVFLIHRIHMQKEYCLLVAQNLTSRYQSWIDDGM